MIKVCKGLTLFHFHSGTQPVSVFILAVNCLCFHSGSQRSVFILAVNCLCFLSGSRLSLFSFWQSTVYVFILALDCLWLPAYRQASLDSLKYQMSQGGAQISQMAEQIADGQSPQEANGRPLSLAECQAIIRHLQQVNERQAHEVLYFMNAKLYCTKGEKNHFLLLLCQIKTQNGKIFKIKKLALICQYKTCTIFWWNHFPQALTKNNMNETGSTYLAFGVIWMSFSWKCCILVIVSESQNPTRSVHSWYNGTGWPGAKQRVTYLLTCAVHSWSDWSRTCATCSTPTSGLQMHTCWPKPTSLRTTRRTTLTLALKVACPRSPWRTKHENCKCALVHHVTISSRCPCHCIRSVSMVSLHTRVGT